MLNEIINTVVDGVSGRAKTRIYRTFIIWLVILHIDFIYFALFVDQALVFKSTGLLKDEYITLNYLNFSKWEFWLVELAKFVLAGLFAYASVWLLPKLLTHRAYSEEIMNDENLKMKKIDSESRLEKAKKKLADEQLEVAKTEANIQKEQVQIVKPDKEIWSEEFEEFKKSKMYPNFNDIVDSILDHYGRTKESDINDNPTWWIDKQVLAYSASNDLVELDHEDASISLTPKGKHFMKMYQLDTQ